MERKVGDLVFKVKRSRRRRTVALRVDPSGAITVFAPPYVWGPFIDRFVHQQSSWILKKLAYFKERTAGQSPPAPVSEAERAQWIDQTLERLTGPVNRL